VSQITLSLALLSLFVAFAALYHSISFCVISIVVLIAEFIFTIYTLAVDKDVTTVYDMIDPTFWAGTIALRIITIILQFFMLVCTITFVGRIGSSALYFKVKHLITNYSRGVTIGYFSTMFHLVILTPLVTITGIVLIVSQIPGPSTLFPSLSFAYYWFVLSCPSTVISETYKSRSFLIYSIIIDAVGIALQFNVLTPGPWVVLIIFPILKVVCAIVSCSVSCCPTPKSELVILPEGESIDRMSFPLLPFPDDSSKPPVDRVEISKVPEDEDTESESTYFRT